MPPPLGLQRLQGERRCFYFFNVPFFFLLKSQVKNKSDTDGKVVCINNINSDPPLKTLHVYCMISRKDVVFWGNFLKKM